LFLGAGSLRFDTDNLGPKQVDDDRRRDQRAAADGDRNAGVLADFKALVRVDARLRVDEGRQMAHQKDECQ